MKPANLFKKLLVPLSLLFLTVYLSGCSKNPLESENNFMSDDDYLKAVVSNGYSSQDDDEDNLMSKEYNDLNQGGAVFDDENNPPTLTPYDSLYKWGRRITNVNVNLNISNEGDSIKNVIVTRTISGNYIIIGYIGGVLDSVSKPYTEVMNRKIAFKRIATFNDPARNWRLYKIGVLDGQTTSPQVGTSKVQMNKAEVFINGILSYTLQGPDFSQIQYITKRFGGTGIPTLPKGAQIQIKIYTTSQNSTIDYVAWHWARNTFGFHRIPFALISQTGSGPYERVYSKTFTVYSNHRIGVHNGYISASTHESLFDNNINDFASDIFGVPYRITQ